MKKCPYCGKEYSDEYSVCANDENPLESCNPKPPASSFAAGSIESPANIRQADADTKEPDGFRSLGLFDPFEADRLLKRFTEAGVRFLIDKIEKRVFSSGGAWSGAGYVTRNLIEIFVHKGDKQKATRIISADWKV